jgi:hypothetical protein
MLDSCESRKASGTSHGLAELTEDRPWLMLKDIVEKVKENLPIPVDRDRLIAAGTHGSRASQATFISVNGMRFGTYAEQQVT